MLYFLIPLRARAVAHDWRVVSELCRRTLQSCSAQTVDRFEIVLICHDVPELPSGIRNLTVLRVDDPVPTNTDEQMEDKYRKLQRALLTLRGRAPFYWMKVDSDDCVSNRLCEFVVAERPKYGCFFPAGYVYSEGQSHLYLDRHTFHQLCGTSTIIPAVDADDFPSERLDTPDLNFFRLHQELVEYRRSVGKPLQPLPFPGAVYCVANGENWSGFTGVTEFRSKKWILRRLFNRRALTPARAREFWLKPLNDGEKPAAT